MIEDPVHPIYQNRHIDGDGVSNIVNEFELSQLIREGALLRFGYWRPHTFNELASLELVDGGALLKGIHGERMVAVDRYAGDPDVLLTEWLSHVAGAKQMDMTDREDAQLARKVRDASYRTKISGGEWDGGDVGVHPVAIHMAIQRTRARALVNGRWAGNDMVKEVARLTWAEDLSIVLTAAERQLTCSAPVDLDAVVGVWLAFVASAREALEFEETLATVRADSGEKGIAETDRE